MSQDTTTAAPTVHRYRIVEGSFRDSDGSIKNVGDTIELADHDAAAHGRAIELVTAEDETADDPAKTVTPEHPAVTDHFGDSSPDR